MSKLTEIEKLLIDLVNESSISGNETFVAELIESKLGGFHVRRQYIDKKRFNVIAQKGKSKVWIVAHMDTVPPFFPVRVTADKIFGRGAIDNKGNIAGAIIAARQLQNINLLFTVGEEKNSDGAKKASIAGRVIILEPMNFEIRTAQCGVVAARLTAKGDQKHSSLLAKKSENAIHVLVEILECLSKKNWHCFNVGMIKGGVAPNIVAGSAEAEFSVRPKSRKEFEEILETIKALKVVKKVIINKMPPFRSSFSEKNISPEPVSFFSELSCFKNGLLWGVGDIAQAHTLTEFIRRNDLRKLPDKLIALIKSLEIA